MKPLKSKPADPQETKRRIDEALGKHDRGEPLTEKELTIVYWVRHGGGCHACGSGRPQVAVTVRSSDGR